MAIFLTGVSNAGRVGRNRNSEPISCCQFCDRPLQVLSIQRCRTTVLQVVSLIAGSKRQSLLIAGDNDEMFMTRSPSVMAKTTERHLIACCDKAVACVTNSKRLAWRFVLLKLTTDKHEASRSLFATAELLVSPLRAASATSTTTDRFYYFD